MAPLVAFVLTACSESVGPKVAPRLEVASGEDQGGIVGDALQTPLTVRLRQGGQPLAGATVTWTVIAGGGVVSPATSVTDANGLAQTTWELGNTEGEQKVRATAPGALPVEFTAYAFTAAGCSSSPLTLAAGQVHTAVGASAAALCVTGAVGGAEYVLVAHNASPNATDTVQLQAMGSVEGMLASAGDALRPSMSFGAAGGIPGAFAFPNKTSLGDDDFHARLRERERRTMQPHIAAARAAVAASPTGTLGPSRAIGTTNPQVGDLVTINAQANSSCTNPINRQGVVKAVSQHAVVVHDLGNPSDGFTDADYQSIAITFDTLIHPTITANFGAPHDIDGNQRAFIFYTREVNALTERGSGSYIGGFYFVRDLFPKIGTADFQGCTTSNEAEIFYMLVPDPTGAVSDARSVDFVRGVTLGTIAHEYQHLINASRRMFVNEADAFEETWLDEGLAHISEELVFYESAGLTPRQNIGIATLLSTSRILDAFNRFGISNFFRFEDFLVAPSTSSPYSDEDDLATRGAAWHFLRYAADRRNASDAELWFSLANSTTIGMNNLANALGATPSVWFRDWATTVYTDDQVPGVPAQYVFPSWDVRSIFSRNPPFPGTYPLVIVQLADGTFASRALVGGGATYLRLTVTGSTTGAFQLRVDGAVPPPSISATLVRVR